MFGEYMIPNPLSLDTNNAEIKSAGILVVDDEVANVKLVEGMFKAQGYTNIYSTTDPREVLDLYKQNHIDIILLDLNMPYMDGYDVMQQLNQEYGATLVLVTHDARMADRCDRSLQLAAGLLVGSAEVQIE